MNRDSPRSMGAPGRPRGGRACSVTLNADGGSNTKEQDATSIQSDGNQECVIRSRLDPNHVGQVQQLCVEPSAAESKIITILAHRRLRELFFARLQAPSPLGQRTSIIVSVGLHVRTPKSSPRESRKKPIKIRNLLTRKDMGCDKCAHQVRVNLLRRDIVVGPGVDGLHYHLAAWLQTPPTRPRKVLVLPSFYSFDHFHSSDHINLWERAVQKGQITKITYPK
mmetsp:Transcript_31003/g.68081  ORF Transcript_31003/g.68081 Transcript_31003/m.68081 type:complete len:223 (+) Transcript_31003:488-1156(+)